MNDIRESEIKDRQSTAERKRDRGGGVMITLARTGYEVDKMRRMKVKMGRTKSELTWRCNRTSLQFAALDPFGAVSNCMKKH